MVIEVLGRLIAKKDDELRTQQETINKLNKKIDAYQQYFDVYENYFKKGENENGNEN